MKKIECGSESLNKKVRAEEASAEQTDLSTADHQIQEII